MAGENKTGQLRISIACMVQPDSLKSEGVGLWSGGRGVDVWAMIKAAATGDLDTIKTLVAHDPALVNCQHEYFHPLRFAVRENQRAVVDYLLQQGANPSDHAGQSLVEVSRDRGYDELTALLESLLANRYHIEPAGEAIIAAIKSRDIEAVEALIEKEPGLVHAADAGGNQPIHWAVLTRQVNMMDYLLQHGADINAMRPDGARPIDLTNGDYDYRSWYRDLPPMALRKHEVLIGWLIARGAYCDISIAAKIGWTERVRELLDEDPALVNRIPAYCGYYSGLPLRCAAAAGHIAVVNLLLERGANPNEPEPGIAPLGGALHAAIGARQYEVVQILLEHGANPNAPVESSGNCMSMARGVGAPKETLRLLAAHGGVLGVGMVCHEGDVETLAAMLHANPKLDLEPGIGSLISNRQCLELALRYQPDLLKRKGPEPRAWWDSGVPNNKDLAHARWLITQGFDPNRPNWLGITNLHRAAANGSTEIATICLECGADINVLEGLYSSTPLGWAAREGKKEMVEWLLSKGANPRLPEAEPWALPLSWAQRRGHHEIAGLLE